ncbi:alpha/beta hydrolase [Pseudoroseomonas deserti]|uniref:Alpha/beta hydrolase n=1 Tax=Teichococcus deserti TaxID=1817963 RepID=A0A1V2H2E0_9PROT|nr:alpha/beta hydrolase [Pseudoroseomonas deserti]ONG53780.1 alpha/beta hydrolase [Pseudoroseomonas deserti]
MPRTQTGISPDLKRLLAAIRLGGAPPFEALTPEAAREAHAARGRLMQHPGVDLPEVRDLDVELPDRRIPLRLYRGGRSEAPQPCLLFLHGGGWVLGSLATHDALCRALAQRLGAAVLAVDYRLAPEHPYPAALDDALAALRWLAAQASSLNIDAARIAVGGDSAGGNLAAILALMGRDGSAPPSSFQMLLYPAVDLRLTADRYPRPSEAMVLTGATMRWFIGHYLPDAAQRSDWRASPLLTPSLAGAPPAFLLTCGQDPLCDEGLDYGDRLQAEGVQVTALHLSGEAHAILTMDKAIGAVPAVLDLAAATLRAAWERQEDQ